MIDLYKKNIWNDPKTVNVIATACLSKNAKVRKSRSSSNATCFMTHFFNPDHGNSFTIFYGV